MLPAALCILLLTAVPAFAEPVKINQVVQTYTSSQGVFDLRLNTIAQDPAKGTQKGSQGEPVAKTQGPASTGGKSDSIMSGVIVTAEGKALGIEDIEEGEVEGTICDCGELLIAGAAFPKWPFLFLAAVPVAFINNGDDENPISTPTPTPPSNPSPTPPAAVPEPASLLMFGTGLVAAGAGLRRRYAKSNQSKGDE